jgi:PAS domain S-box-containing protein
MAIAEKTTTPRKRSPKPASEAAPVLVLSQEPEETDVSADEFAHLLAAISEMHEQQAAGEYDFYIDESRFSGPAAEIVEAMNRSVKLHVDNILEILGIAGEYADGDLTRKLRPLPGRQVIGNQLMDKLQASLQALVDDASMLAQAGREGDYLKRPDSEAHQGCFRAVVDGVGEALDAVADRVFWYESLLDAIPFPISVTDLDMNWTFINRPVESLLGITRADVLGLPCSKWNADICGTEKCGVAGLRKGIATSTFRNQATDGNFRVDTSYLVDRHGQQVGHIEVVQDITASARAYDFMAAEVALLSADLQRLAAGDLEFEAAVSEGDEHTTRVRDGLVVVADNVNHVRDAVSALVSDAGLLATAAARGELTTRADAGRYEGGFRKLIEDVNQTLEGMVQCIDSLSTPVIIMDPELSIRYLNQAAVSLTGLSAGEVVGRKCHEFLQAGDCRTPNCACTRAVKEGQTADSETTVSLGSETLEIRYTGSPLRDRDGQVVGVVESIVDQTEAKTAARVAQRLSDYQEAQVQKVKGALESMAAGDLNFTLEIDEADGALAATQATFGVLAQAVGACAEAVRGLVADANMLSEAAVRGELSTRADATRHQGDFRKVVEGVNSTLDAVVGPLNIAAWYVEQISRGAIPEAITDEYNGEFNTIKDNLNQCIAAVNALVVDADTLARAAVEGELETRADASLHQGDFRKVVEGINGVIDAIAQPLHVAYVYLDRIAQGDLSKRITVQDEATNVFRGGYGELKDNLNTCMDAIASLVADAGMLADAGVRGELSTRADAERHQGDFRRIVEGVNATLDAVVGPLNIAAWYVERISRGDIPEPIVDEYHGDFRTLKDNLNSCVAGLGGLVEANAVLQRMAVNDHTLSVTGEYQGVFAEVGEAVNDVRDRLKHLTGMAQQVSVGDLHELDQLRAMGDGTGRRSAQDELVPAFITMMENIGALVSDAVMLSEAAVEGRLEVRADATRHEGEYRKVVEGVNNTLDAVIGPLNVAAYYVDSISQGTIPAPIADDYNGDFNAIKNNLNQCISAVNALVADANMLADAAQAGQLSTRADASRHQGDFRRIVEGVNGTLDSVIRPVEEAAAALEQMAARDLTARVLGDYQGDHARIKEALNQAAGNLDEGLQQVASASEQVSSAAGQIGSGSQAVAQGASEQASSLEEISSSLQEMASMTRQNAANAQEARSLSDAARGSVGTGVDSMRRLSEAIERIKRSSDDTAKIVKTIDEIAFQTNLLALNAAVEAARAGDAGKGFAVVAEEVRNLAMRSAEAAKNTANLIEGSVKNAEQGVAINQEVFANLEEINTQVRKVGEVMAEIAAASEQQSEGIEQVTQAVSQMDQVTQQNAANSEESASAAQELASQAAEMNGLVETYRLSSARAADAPGKRRGTAAPAAGQWGASRNAVQPVRRPANTLIPMPDDRAGGGIAPDDEAVLQRF